MSSLETDSSGPPRLELATTFTFEASHQLHKAPAHSKCARLHGHSWKVDVLVEGELDEERGWVVDFDDIARAFEPVYDALDHRHLNDVEGLETPTSELVAIWIWNRLAGSLPELSGITVHETCTARCTYRGPGDR
jgi:6-pyruvoyltetrahydropterin/6-carboxytetrahydropterin synthase